ncbi:efflux transporter periplasmic adaptor subunit [Arachidicoccus ginsenosidimutans]|uniref:efflux RND transporter periplasmic adaptor subunit n=1 Tax=Arachidicoccus sp. BS20 TaxID=1850526 RepID=UPI0007F07127|nr:efflux RND transporter periplasmic adaptor subunit [Arachidicoccus sp. BS20]ANI88610.1 efflux transporter periplasmic adaptor subunit [Arachidicoccus sp. BS20]
MKTKNSGSLLFIIGAIIFLQSCSSNKPQTADNTADSKYVLPDSLLKTITIDTVKNSVYSNAITLTGQVDFDEDHVIKIYPMVSGVAQDIRTALGDYVQKGQVLAIFRSSDMTGFSNDLATTESELQIAKHNREVTISMYKSGLASKTDSLNAEEQYVQAKANAQKAQRILDNNGGSSNGEYVVRAPISGFIVEKNINNGMAVRNDNGNNLFTISDLNTVWVMANVYESNISYIKSGDSVDVTTLSYPGKIFRGKIDKIMNVLDPDSRVMKVRIVLNNPGYLLKPAMFTSVSVSYSDNKQMISIPSSALVFDNNQNYVLVYKSPSDITIVPVEVDGTKGDRTYISSGLQDGQLIISSQALLIYQALNS